ncbi:hypothetical protein FB451DRAFT_1561917 [Mycena latifolia]|nr:hypothetical protein FB451DRAFT_1561917 [Mycena latifolia]
MITAAETMDVYVNGEYIRSNTPSHHPHFAQRFCVDFLPSFNVFAVNASTPVTTNAEILATILLTYSDGTTVTIVTDPSWRLSFDDTQSAPPGRSPQWQERTPTTHWVNIPSSPPVIKLDHVSWIWTDVVPAGSRAFRRTFTPAPGQLPGSASILITADNQYTPHVNGISIGNVLATNNAASVAGVIFAMEVNMQPAGRANCTAGSFGLSDDMWKSTKGAIPTGFEQPGFDDSAWQAVTEEESYGGATWGTITIAAPAAPVTIYVRLFFVARESHKSYGYFRVTLISSDPSRLIGKSTHRSALTQRLP